MSPLRLLGGWLLLCGLSAGGAYFAMDEADRRWDLSRYDLRAKVGLNSSPSPTPSPAPGPQPPITPPGPSGSSGPVSGSPPPSVTPPPVNPPVVGSGGPVQPIGGHPVLPNNPPVGPLRGGTGKGQPPVNPNQPVTKPNPVQPNTPNNPPPNNPQTSNPQTSNPPPNSPPPNNPQTSNPQTSNPPPNHPQTGTTPPAGQVTQPDPRTTDQWRTLRSTYEQMAPRSQAVLGYLEQMRRQTERNRGVFRVDLQTGMTSLRDSMEAAKRALDAGDVDSTRSYLSTAWQQLAFLEQNRR